eukprot:13530-Heterococcus_DN1.PRE.3
MQHLTAKQMNFCISIRHCVVRCDVDISNCLVLLYSSACSLFDTGAEYATRLHYARHTKRPSHSLCQYAHYSSCHNERIRCSKARCYSRTLTWCGSIMRVRSLIGTAIGHEESKMCCAPKYQRLKGSTLMCCNAMSALRNQDVCHAKPGFVLSGAQGAQQCDMCMT